MLRRNGLGLRLIVKEKKQERVAAARGGLSRNDEDKADAGAEFKLAQMSLNVVIC